MTVNEYIEQQIEAFRRLSRSRQRTLRREATRLIEAHRQMADTSTFWRGLSARQILAALPAEPEAETYASPAMRAFARVYPIEQPHRVGGKGKLLPLVNALAKARRIHQKTGVFAAVERVSLKGKKR